MLKATSQSARNFGFLKIFLSICVIAVIPIESAKAGDSDEARLVFEGGSVTYSVLVATSDKDNAGTDGDVYITLYGMGGKSEKKLLDTKELDDFERGSRQLYPTRVDGNLGRLTKIKLELDGGADDGWHVEKVRVFGPSLGDRDWPKFDPNEVGGLYYVVGGFPVYRSAVMMVVQDPGLLQLDQYVFDVNEWLDSDEAERSMRVEKFRRGYEETRAKDVVGLVAGKWVKTCSNAQTCGTELVQSVEYGRGHTKTNSEEIGKSIAVSVTAGYESPSGGKVESTVTAQASQSVTEAFESSTSETAGSQNSCSTTNTFTRPTVVYQWQMTANMGFGSVTIKTCELACVVDDDEIERLKYMVPGYKVGPLPSCFENENRYEWRRCAGERGTCEITDSTLVRYGTKSRGYRYAYKGSGAFTCHHATPGLGPDPAVGQAKECDYLAAPELEVPEAS